MVGRGSRGVKYIGNENQSDNGKRLSGMEEVSVGGQGRQWTSVFEDDDDEEEEEEEEEEDMM